jgi:hypothetical protein
LAAQRQKLVKEGQTLDTADAIQAELTDQANGFTQKLWPILKALQIA